MKLGIAAIGVLLAIGQSAFAGANNAVVECKSASGRTTLSIDYPVDMTSAAATLTVDGKSISYVNQDKVDDAALNNEDLQKEYPNYVVKEFKPNQDKNNVDLWIGEVTDRKFDENDLVLTSAGGIARAKISNGYMLKFNATIDGTDPRDQQKALPQITVTCQFKYQI